MLVSIPYQHVSYFTKENGRNKLMSEIDGFAHMNTLTWFFQHEKFVFSVMKLII